MEELSNGSSEILKISVFGHVGSTPASSAFKE